MYNIWILPVVYCVCFSICLNNAKSIKGNPGSLILNCIMPIRYVVLPIIIYSYGVLSKYNHGFEYMNKAVLLMTIELIFIFLSLELSAKKYNATKTNNNEEHYYTIPNGWIIAVIVFIILFGIAVLFKDLSSGIKMIISGVPIGSDTVLTSNIANVTWQVLSVWLFVYLIMSCKRREIKSQKKCTVFVTVFTLIFGFITFIETVEFNRWYTIISVFAALSTTIHLFPEKKRILSLFIFIPIALLMLLITAYKNAGYSRMGDISLKDSLQNLLDPSILDIYFSGPVGVNNAIALKEKSGLNFFSVFPDLLNNMPKIGNFLNPNSTTNYSYNVFLNRIYGNSRGDLIIPLIGQSSIYFGYFLSPPLSVIVVLVMRWCDYRFNKTYSFTTYSFAFASISFAVTPMMLNLTINANLLYIRILPFALVLFLTNELAIKNKRIERKKKYENWLDNNA